MLIRLVAKIADMPGVAPLCADGASRVEHATRVQSAATRRRHRTRMNFLSGAQICRRTSLKISRARSTATRCSRRVAGNCTRVACSTREARRAHNSRIRRRAASIHTS